MLQVSRANCALRGCHMSVEEVTTLIVSGGLTGLSLGVTLYQIGLPFRIFESVPKIKPLGVGVNLLPNAVRELYGLGLRAALPEVGVQTRDYDFYARKGL